MQEFEAISEKKQNELSRLYPFWFDEIPETIPFPLLFGAGNYDISQQVALEEMLELKGQSVQAVHDQGIEFNDQTVLASAFVQKRYQDIRAEKNFADRRAAGAVRAGSLGIVGNNLDNCNTSLEKKTRAGLYRAQNMIQKIRLDGEPIVSETVCNCGRPLGPVVELQRNREHGSASVNGVQTCGSVWACPVCRSRIISERSEELKEIYQRWSEKGGQMYMVTLTVPHEKGDNLAELYGSNYNGTGISGALSKFRQSRAFSKDFKDETGYYGDIRGIEVTWGWHNGFHPHIHMLILTKDDWHVQKWEQLFFKAWNRACQRSGLQAPSFERGIQISKCQQVDQAQYLAKWSAASEVQSTGMKEAKAGNFSITELERCLWDKTYRNRRKIRRSRAASVLRAYYGAMKGQRMLQTGGIGPDGSWKKELLEIPDEDVPDRETHDRICFLEYKVYCQIKRSGKLPDLLQASERGETGKDRKSNVKFWLQKHGYDPGAMDDPYPPDPAPNIFSYTTDFDNVEFEPPDLN